MIFDMPWAEVLKLELNVDAACVGVHAVPDEFGERLHRLGTRLPGHEVVFDLDLYVFNLSHGDPYNMSTAAEGEEHIEN
jgi:hypothetical protein